MSLDEEKRERIINAGMKEFTKGYKHALTDNIVKDAGISKGSLFNYFGNKQQLLAFLIDYGASILKSELIDKVDKSERDFFKFLWQMAETKIKLSYRYPDMFDFMGAVYVSEEPEFKIHGENIRDLRNASWNEEQLFSNIDFSRFKEGLDMKKTLNLINWSLNGLGEDIIKKYETTRDWQAQYEEMMEEVDSYVQMLKQLFYKAEFHENMSD